jgi:hypothetical protein
MVLFKLVVTSLLVKTIGFGVGLDFGKLELEKWGYCSSRSPHASREVWNASRLCWIKCLASREGHLAARFGLLSGNFVSS